MSHLGVLAQSREGKGELPKNEWQRKKVREDANEHKRKRHKREMWCWIWRAGAEKGSERDVGLRGKKSPTWYERMSGCLTTTGSWLLVSSRWSQYPWKPSLRPLAPAALRVEKRGEERREEKRKSEWQGHSVQCGEGWSKGIGGGGRGGGGSSRVEQTGIHTTCVFYFTKQGHRVWEIYPSISSPPPHTSSLGEREKKNTWRTSIFPKQQACQREHQHQEGRGEGDRQSGRKTELSKSKKKKKMLKWESGQLNEKGGWGGGGLRMRRTQTDRNILRASPVGLCFSLRGAALFYCITLSTDREEKRLLRKPSENRAIMDSLPIQPLRSL